MLYLSVSLCVPLWDVGACFPSTHLFCAGLRPEPAPPSAGQHSGTLAPCSLLGRGREMLIHFFWSSFSLFLCLSRSCGLELLIKSQGLWAHSQPGVPHPSMDVIEPDKPRSEYLSCPPQVWSVRPEAADLILKWHQLIVVQSRTDWVLCRDGGKAPRVKLYFSTTTRGQ